MIVIAHRGACGYLPEHTLAAKALAFAMGVDFLEQDVVMTKDDHPIVLHDIHLDTVTDVSSQFPGRHRDDKRYYAIDFTLDEINQLQVHERVDHETNQTVFPGRFPVGKSRFEIPTLKEEIELIQGLNKSTGKNVGIYPEIKRPAWHRREGKDISMAVLKVLAEYGYDSREDAIYLQCFDPQETRRLRDELETDLKLIQLIGENKWDEAAANFDQLRTAAGIQEIAEYADGIGPWLPHILKPAKNTKGYILTRLVAWAHDHQLKVHAYTLRADSLPAYAESLDALLTALAGEVKVDGVFTDFPDKVIKSLSPR